MHLLLRLSFVKKSDSEVLYICSAAGKAAALRQIVTDIKTWFSANQHYDLHFVGDITRPKWGFRLRPLKVWSKLITEMHCYILWLKTNLVLSASQKIKLSNLTFPHHLPMAASLPCSWGTQRVPLLCHQSSLFWTPVQRWVCESLTRERGKEEKHFSL